MIIFKQKGVNRKIVYFENKGGGDVCRECALMFYPAMIFLKYANQDKCPRIHSLSKDAFDASISLRWYSIKSGERKPPHPMPSIALLSG